MRELGLFTGAGGGVLAGHLLGWQTVCAVESDPYCRDLLMARQNDGTLAPFPIWDDVRTFDGRPWRGCVDVVSGGFPCQDISLAGAGAGIDGERSGLWGDMARIVRDVRPRFVFVENSPALTARGLDRVLGDLAERGYDAEWDVLGADDCEGPQTRKRIWILAHAHGGRRGGIGVDRLPSDSEPLARMDSDRRGCPLPGPVPAHGAHGAARCRGWPPEPAVGRVAHGLAVGLDRLRALGNGQVPRVAAAAFELLRRRGGWS